MISKQLMKLSNRNDWKHHEKEDSVFGEYNGYLFTVLEGNDFKAILTPVAGISREGLKVLDKFLRDHVKALRLHSYDWADNFLCIRQKENLLPLSADRMEDLLAQISGLLSQYDLPTDACVICGKTATTQGLYLGLLCHMHPECEKEEILDFTHTDEDDAMTGEKNEEN